MAVAVLTRYDTLPERAGEAMKKRSRAGGKLAKARSRKALKPKRDVAPRIAPHGNSATQEIVEWLEELGLGRYGSRFAENDITFAILNDVTDQDLKELGVASLGHRRQLLRAIAELNGVQKEAPKPALPVTPHDVADVFGPRRLDRTLRAYGP